MKRLGEKLEDIVEKTEIELLTYAPEMGEPTPDRVDRAAAYAKDNQVDGLVALGGGATIDITKLVAKILVQFKQMCCWNGIEKTDMSHKNVWLQA